MYGNQYLLQYLLVLLAVTVQMPCLLIWCLKIILLDIESTPDVILPPLEVTGSVRSNICSNALLSAKVLDVNHV